MLISAHTFSDQSAYKDRGVVKAIESSLFLSLRRVNPFDFVTNHLTLPSSFTVMEEEIKLGMRLLGVTSIDQLGPEYVECLPPSSYQP